MGFKIKQHGREIAVKVDKVNLIRVTAPNEITASRTVAELNRKGNISHLSASKIVRTVHKMRV